jgi:hypothetical protein
MRYISLGHPHHRNSKLACFFVGVDGEQRISEGCVMRVREVTFQLGRNYSAIMECEHCNNTQEERGCYDDAYFDNHVIPAMVCKSCGKNRAGEVLEEKE